MLCPMCGWPMLAWPDGTMRCQNCKHQMYVVDALIRAELGTMAEDVSDKPSEDPVMDPLRPNPNRG